MVGIATAESITTRPGELSRIFSTSLHRIDACGVICTGISIKQIICLKRSFDDERRRLRKLDAGFKLELGENGDARWVKRTDIT